MGEQKQREAAEAAEQERVIAKIRETVDRPIIAGNLSEVRDTVAAYQQAGVDELIVPDFPLGSGQQKLDILDTFINDIAPVAR